MGERTRSLLIYTAKCVTGTLVTFILFYLLNYKDLLGWCLISVILVLSPDGKDSVSLAFTRIKANVLGATVGLLCLLIAPNNMWVMSLAIAVTLSLCYVFKLDDGARSAMAAAIIILLHPEGRHIWDTALQRVAAVFVGCALGLIITFIFHFKNSLADQNKINDDA